MNKEITQIKSGLRSYILHIYETFMNKYSEKKSKEEVVKALIDEIDNLCQNEDREHLLSLLIPIFHKFLMEKATRLSNEYRNNNDNNTLKKGKEILSIANYIKEMKG